MSSESHTSGSEYEAKRDPFGTQNSGIVQTVDTEHKETDSIKMNKKLCKIAEAKLKRNESIGGTRVSKGGTEAN